MPGIAERIAFKSLDPDTTFFLFNKKNSDLVDLFLNNNLGGPALIFTRFAEKGTILYNKCYMICYNKIGGRCYGRCYLEICKIVYVIFTTGATRIRSAVGKLVQKILGLDANSLYLGKRILISNSKANCIIMYLDY